MSSRPTVGWLPNFRIKPIDVLRRSWLVGFFRELCANRYLVEYLRTLKFVSFHHFHSRISTAFVHSEAIPKREIGRENSINIYLNPIFQAMDGCVPPLSSKGLLNVDFWSGCVFSTLPLILQWMGSCLSLAEVIRFDFPSTWKCSELQLWRNNILIIHFLGETAEYSWKM